MAKKHWERAVIRGVQGVWYKSIADRYDNDADYRARQAEAREDRDLERTPMLGFDREPMNPNLADLFGIPGSEASEVEFMDDFARMNYEYNMPLDEETGLRVNRWGHDSRAAPCS